MIRRVSMTSPLLIYIYILDSINVLCVYIYIHILQKNERKLLLQFVFGLPTIFLLPVFHQERLRMLPGHAKANVAPFC